MPSLNPDLYTVAWIAPLEIEARAALCVFDEVHDGDFPVARGHDYIFHAGRICGHNVVLATLPPGQPYGTGSAGALAGQVKMSFPNLWFGLLVGVAAGLPNLLRSPSRDIRLGDVLVALPEGDCAGLIAYDLGKQLGEDNFQLLHGGHALAKTETVVRSAIGKIKLKAPKDTEIFLPHYQRIEHEEHAIDTFANGTFADPGQDRDVLYELHAVHRPHRPDAKRTRVWYGPIGSGEKLMRDATRRNELRDRYGIIGLEMEAAGTMNTISVGVIRGVCDYADSHKNKDWQPYAAAMAAAYAKAVLDIIQPKKVRDCHFIVPFDRNEDFVGRESTLQRLLERIPPSIKKDGCQRTAIEGLGGIGKTQVALEAAYRVRDSHSDCSIFWVPAVDAASFERAYRQIGKALGVSGLDDDKADVKELVKEALSHSGGEWLLIVDNADDKQLLFGGSALRDYLPSNHKGSILFTTRTHEVARTLDIRRDDVIQVTGLTRSEARTLLTKHLHEDQISDTERTAELLDFMADLPLAIKQAAAYIDNTRMTTTRYLEYCQESDKKFVMLLNKDFGDRFRYKNTENPVAMTWLISFRHIRQDNPLAARCLMYMSFLAEKDIPKSILCSDDDQLEIDEAIGVLKAYAFIIQRADLESYDMHRLVRLIMRNWLSQEGEFEKSVTSVIQQVGRKFPFPTHQNKSIWTMYLPHALIALEFRGSSTNKVAIFNLLFNVAQSNLTLGKYQNAEAMYQETLELKWEVLGLEHPSTLASMNNLARVFHSQGKYAEAEQMHRQTLELMEKVLGREHPDTLNSMNGLAIVFDRQGKYAEAEQMHRQTLKLMEKVLGREHLYILGNMNNLAFVLDSQRKYAEAEQMHRQTLELKEKVLGREHPDTLSSMNGLAIVFDNQGKYAEAEQIHRQTLELKEKVLGREHPGTFNSMNGLAIVLRRQGKYAEAEQIHRQTLKLTEKVLGREHPFTLASMNNLALVLVNQKKYQDAERMYRQVLQLYENVLGFEHPSTKRCRKNLQNCLKAAKEGEVVRDGETAREGEDIGEEEAITERDDVKEGEAAREGEASGVSGVVQEATVVPIKIPQGSG